MDSFIKLEIEIEAPTRASLLRLDENCLLEILDFLDIDQSINLAKTCRRVRFVADRLFRRHSKCRLDSRIVNKGEEYIDCLFQHIGPHLTSLDFGYDGDSKLDCDEGNLDLSKILSKISNNCKNLKKLKLCYRESLCHRDVQSTYRFDNVEQLTLSNCHDKFTEEFAIHFFESFHRLTSLNIVCSFIESNELKIVFQNNPNIENFVYACCGRDFNCQFLELIPNVERLCLISSYTTILELDSLLQLNRLTKLRLHGDFSNINNFLRELATKGIIEEMDLWVKVDDDFFETLASFSKLQLLVLSGRRQKVKLKSPIAWPAQLKKLRLWDIRLTQNDLISIIQQIQCIEGIDIVECIISVNDIIDFNRMTKLAQDIRHIINHSNRKHRLDVVLPEVSRYCLMPAGPSMKYLIESERLTVSHHHRSDNYNSLGIHIRFDSLV